MSRLLEIIYGTAFFLIITGALLADGLAEIDGGFYILGGIVAVAGVLVFTGNRIEDAERYHRKRRERRD